MSQPLPYDEIEILHGKIYIYLNKLAGNLKTPDDIDIRYSIEVDLRYPDNTKEKTKNFPFCPENKVIPKEKYNKYMKKIKLNNYTKTKNL